MTNTMTPSEIAESVDWKAEWELACALRIADRQKSQEIINERDAANDKLKIATEALEEARRRLMAEGNIRGASQCTQALARIKEVG